MSDLTQTKQESPKKRVVGNITTEILVGSAATRLESAAKSILNAMDSNTIKRLEQEVREARELTKAVAEAGKIGSINLPSGK